jgi:hypothetical protein
VNAPIPTSGVLRVAGLAAAAAHLCRARDELVALGYAPWGASVDTLIEIIAAEIAWLESAPPRPG